MHKTDLLPMVGAIRDAIARESQLKKWSRAKKVTLINHLNPNWRDLGADVLQDS
jgi:predicted GIY-YIG superfamily endonuclease